MTAQTQTKASKQQSTFCIIRVEVTPRAKRQRWSAQHIGVFRAKFKYDCHIPRQFDSDGYPLLKVRLANKSAALDFLSSLECPAFVLN